MFKVSPKIYFQVFFFLFLLQGVPGIKTSKAFAVAPDKDAISVNLGYENWPVPDLHEWGNILLAVLLLVLSWIFFTKNKKKYQGQ